MTQSSHAFGVPACILQEGQQILESGSPLEALALILVKSAECSQVRASELVDGSRIVVSAVKKLDSDFYLTLRVDHDCEQAEIKKSYRKLILQYHPDKNQHAAALFQIVHAAYEVLSSPESRSRYDEKFFGESSGPSRTGNQSYRDIYNEWRNGGMSEYTDATASKFVPRARHPTSSPASPPETPDRDQHGHAGFGRSKVGSSKSSSKSQRNGSNSKDFHTKTKSRQSQPDSAWHKQQQFRRRQAELEERRQERLQRRAQEQTEELKGERQRLQRRRKALSKQRKMSGGAPCDKDQHQEDARRQHAQPQPQRKAVPLTTCTATAKSNPKDRPPQRGEKTEPTKHNCDRLQSPVDRALPQSKNDENDSDSEPDNLEQGAVESMWGSLFGSPPPTSCHQTEQNTEIEGSMGEHASKEPSNEASSSLHQNLTPPFPYSQRPGQPHCNLRNSTKKNINSNETSTNIDAGNDDACALDVQTQNSSNQHIEMHSKSDEVATHPTGSYDTVDPQVNSSTSVQNTRSAASIEELHASIFGDSTAVEAPVPVTATSPAPLVGRQRSPPKPSAECDNHKEHLTHSTRRRDLQMKNHNHRYGDSNHDDDADEEDPCVIAPNNDDGSPYSTLPEVEPEGVHNVGISYGFWEEANQLASLLGVGREDALLMMVRAGGTLEAALQVHENERAQHLLPTKSKTGKNGARGSGAAGARGLRPARMHA